MTEHVSISDKPLSVAELELKRELITSQISESERRLYFLKWSLLCLSALLAITSVAGNLYWHWLPWNEFVAAAFAGGAVFSFALAAVVAVVAVVAGVAVAVVVAGAVSGVWLIRMQDRIEANEKELANYSYSDRHACIQIKDWLADADIHQFRDWVQSEGRLFTVGEVEAMRLHRESRIEREKKAKHEAEIEEACREVYVENLISQ